MKLLVNQNAATGVRMHVDSVVSKSSETKERRLDQFELGSTALSFGTQVPVNADTEARARSMLALLQTSKAEPLPEPVLEQNKVEKGFNIENRTHRRGDH